MSALSLRRGGGGGEDGLRGRVGSEGTVGSSEGSSGGESEREERDSGLGRLRKKGSMCICLVVIYSAFVLVCVSPVNLVITEQREIISSLIVSVSDIWVAF